MENPRRLESQISTVGFMENLSSISRFKFPGDELDRFLEISSTFGSTGPAHTPKIPTGMNSQIFSSFP